MQKFENVDVLAALEQIMRQHTAFYQNDFDIDIDKSIIHRDAASDQAVDKALLWMSRPSGTYCFRERDVFLKGTRQHNTWKFYGEQTRDKILAYAAPGCSFMECAGWLSAYPALCTAENTTTFSLHSLLEYEITAHYTVKGNSGQGSKTASACPACAELNGYTRLRTNAWWQ